MQTFLLDLRGPAGLGPATPLLYPLLGAGRLVPVPMPASLEGAAEAVGVRLRRALAPRWRPLVLAWLKPDGPGLAEQLGALDAHLLDPLAAQGLPAAEAALVAFDLVARAPLTGRPLAEAAVPAWERDHAALPERLGDGGRAPATLIRFPFRTAPEPHYQRDLLHAVYLLGVLLRADALPVPGRAWYRVREVALDADAVARWMREHAAHLRAAQEAVTRRLERAPVRRVPLLRDVACGCTGTLEDFEAREPAFGWLQDREDGRRWARWGRDTGGALADREGEEAALLARCRREHRARSPRPVEEDVDDLDAAVEAARGHLDRVRRALIEDVRPEGVPDWGEGFAARTPPVVEAVEARPRTRALAVSGAAALALSVLPLLLALPGASARGHLAWAGAVVGLLLLLTALLLAGLAVRLRRRAHAVAEWAEELASRIRRRLERRQAHLGRLCALEAARHDQERLRAAREAAGRERERLLFHRQALGKHLADAESVVRAATEGAAPPRTGARERLPEVPPDWPSDRPPHRHATYAPSAHPPPPGDPPSGGAGTYELRAGARTEGHPAEGLFGLVRIHLEREGGSASGEATA